MILGGTQACTEAEDQRCRSRVFLGVPDIDPNSSSFTPFGKVLIGLQLGSEDIDWTSKGVMVLGPWLHLRTGKFLHW